MTLKPLSEYITFKEVQEEFPQASHILQWTSHALVEIGGTEGIQKKWDRTLKCYVFTRGSIIEYIQYIVVKNRRKLKALEAELTRKGLPTDI